MRHSTSIIPALGPWFRMCSPLPERQAIHPEQVLFLAQTANGICLFIPST